jgi:hypothetical protein
MQNNRNIKHIRTRFQNVSQVIRDCQQNIPLGSIQNDANWTITLNRINTSGCQSKHEYATNEQVDCARGQHLFVHFLFHFVSVSLVCERQNAQRVENDST